MEQAAEEESDDSTHEERRRHDATDGATAEDDADRETLDGKHEESLLVREVAVEEIGQDVLTIAHDSREQATDQTDDKTR
jgi:hypothetical protein